MRSLRSLSPLQNHSIPLALASLVLGVFVLAGCDAAGPSSSDGTRVEVGFATTSSASTATTSAHSLARAADGLEVSGTNGTLTVDDLRIIVSEVELEGDGDDAEFESERPSFVDLPLDSNNVAQVVADEVPPGTYNEFGFEVEDIEVDDDDDDEELSQLREEIENEGFANWPDEASMVVVGTFTPDEGEARSFTTYFEAEIEVEIEMEDRSFEVGEDGAPRQLTVNLDPSRWFSNPDGTVDDLSKDDYETTNELVEFELEYEFEDGVTKIEFDD